MNAIETHQLTRRYGRTEAIHGLDLVVPSGCICAFIGPNGAGKTTTIKVLMNLLEPSSGDALVLGVDSRRLSPRERRQIGYVSENQKLPDWMTIAQFLRYCRPFYPTWDRDLEAKLMRTFDLPPDRKLKDLSRGMLMKASLLSSLAYRPKLLVLDEPFSGLDPLVRDEFVQGALEIAQQEEWTLFVSSHDINEVEQLADRVAVLDNGRLSFSERTEDLLGRFRKVEVSLPPGTNAPEALPRGWLEVSREGNSIRAIETRYEPGSFERECVERFKGAEVAARNMTLREIFVVLAREGRVQGKKSAA